MGFGVVSDLIIGTLWGCCIGGWLRRSLDIRFSGETGHRKGSWKGGTVGHSINMLPGELHEAAFHRYCTEHEMTFIGEAAPDGIVVLA